MNNVKGLAAFAAMIGAGLLSSVAIGQEVKQEQKSMLGTPTFLRSPRIS